MKISKIFYFSLLLISTSLIFYYVLNRVFLSNKKSIFETNKKYLDEVYSEYKKINNTKKSILTKNQFLNIFHCYYVISQLEISDYGEMLIYFFEKNPQLYENFALFLKEKFANGFVWLFSHDLNIPNEQLFSHDLNILNGQLFSQENKEKASYIQNFEEFKLEIRILFKNLENNDFYLDVLNLVNIKKWNETRNDIKMIFKSTTFINQHLQRLIPFFNICITNEDILFDNYSITEEPNLLYIIDYFKLNWSKTLSTEIMDSIFEPEFKIPKGSFSYFYISIYSLIYTVAVKEKYFYV